MVKLPAIKISVIDMAGITKRELSARRQRLRDELPNHGWDYVKAGIAAGYSRAYAETHLKTRVTRDVKFCQAVSVKRAEIEASTQDKRERCLKVLDSIIEDEKAAARDRIRATEVRGRMCGWMSETRVLETPERQREFSEAEKEEARRIASIRFDTRLLPGEPGVQDYGASGTGLPALCDRGA
jgi:hypothetical protein